MPIIYTVVSRGSTVLAEFTSTTGNFVIITRRILEKIPVTDARMIYEYDNYLFHYVVEKGIIYLCITDKGFPRRQAFAFLEDVKQRFEKAYESQMHGALAYAMNEDFARTLQRQMEVFSQPSDRISQVRSDIDDVRGIMISNIEKVMGRAEKIDLLVGKTESLNQQAFRFKKQSGNLKTAMWWRNMKLNCLILAIVFAFIMIIVFSVCGIKFKNC